MLSKSFHDKKPIFLQIKDRIEDQIVNEQLEEDDQLPSTTQMVNFYKVNHITALKGINLLVDDGIVYKKRGVGMFVAEGAKEKLLKKRRDLFADHYVLPMIQEAKKLGLSATDIETIVRQVEECDGNEV